MPVDVVKQKYSRIFIIIAVIVLLPSLLYAAKTFTPSPPTMNATDNKPTPTQTPRNLVVSQTAKPFREQLMEKIEKRTPLSQNDAKVKATLLEKVSADGSLYQEKLFRIQYVQALDLFKVEIMTTDVEHAKIGGNKWFLDQGMSQQGICDLPLQFYLNFDVQLQLPNLKNKFNPLPLGCYSE